MMEFNFSDFKISGEKFLTSLCHEVETLGIPLTNFTIDHLCFRVESEHEYTFYKNALEHHGDLLTEEKVNGRAISTFKLKIPFVSNKHNTKILELPAPKIGSHYLTGFEHAEFLLNDSFDSFCSKYPKLNFIQSGLNTINPELCLKINQTMQVKFHHKSLEQIIEIEKLHKS